MTRTYKQVTGTIRLLMGIAEARSDSINVPIGLLDELMEVARKEMEVAYRTGYLQGRADQRERRHSRHSSINPYSPASSTKAARAALENLHKLLKENR